MIDVIEIIVSINGAKAIMSEQIYSNNANQYRALVKFEDDSWENYDKMIVFDRVKNYDTPIAIMVNNDNKAFEESISTSGATIIGSLTQAWEDLKATKSNWKIELV